MKICHMTSAHNTDDIRIFYKECVSLANTGYDVYLVGKGENREECGVHIVGVGELKVGRLKRMLSFSKMVYKAALAIDADIYHFHDPELLPYGLKLKKKGKKVIFDSHENYVLQIREKTYIPRALRLIIAKLYGLYEVFVCKRIDCVIYPCTVNGKNFFENRAKKSVKIENYSMLVPFVKGEVSPRQAVYAGSLSEDRGLFNMTQATYLAGGTLVLCGSFASESEEKALYELEASACVDYKGKKNRLELFQIYNQSAVGLSVLRPVGQYPFVDNLSTKICEYMQCGIPVVMSNFLYSRKKNEQYKFGICVNPDNVDEIADAIKYLLDNPEKAKEMGENGRRAVEEEFNWGIEEKKLIELYKSLS